MTEAAVWAPSKTGAYFTRVISAGGLARLLFVRVLCGLWGGSAAHELRERASSGEEAAGPGCGAAGAGGDAVHRVHAHPGRSEGRWKIARLPPPKSQKMEAGDVCLALKRPALRREIKTPSLCFWVSFLKVMISAMPSFTGSVITGCLFGLCGFLGSKGRSTSCACCFCCCNACCCVLAVLSLGLDSMRIRIESKRAWQE